VADRTNAIESLNRQLSRLVRMRGHFPNDEAATKLIWLQLREITKDWKMPPREWAMFFDDWISKVHLQEGVTCDKRAFRTNTLCLGPLLETMIFLLSSLCARSYGS